MNKKLVRTLKLLWRPFRIVLGASLMGYGFYSGNQWYYWGVVPFIAGSINFCPICQLTGACEIEE